MSTIMQFAGPLGVTLAYAAIILLCLAGIVLSCISFSGTWLVLAGTVMAAFIPPSDFPGWWTVGIFAVISVVVEIVEAVAAAFGVKRRGGSALAGWAALAGGLIGIVVGSPIPIIGSLVGMLVCSFALVYAVELHRLKKSDDAVNIATGAVIARIATVLLKVIVTLGMTAWLAGGIIIQSFGS
jgi:uncharacterized protein YqgC (DUF456 family)